MRTVIHPGHIFHAFPVTYFGNQRIIVKRKNKVRNFFLKIRREPGFKFRVITLLGILKRIFNYLRCTAVFRQMRKRIQEVDVTVTVPVHEENFHMCSAVPGLLTLLLQNIVPGNAKCYIYHRYIYIQRSCRAANKCRYNNTPIKKTQR